MNTNPNLARGIYFTLLATLCYSSVYVLGSWLQGRFSLFQILLFQHATPLLFLAKELNLRRLETPHWKIHLVRSFSGIFGYYFIFLSLKSLNLVDATALNFLFPFIVPILGYYWLKEEFPKKILWGIGVGFTGVIILLNPTWNFFNIGGIFGLASGFTSALSLTAIRNLNLKKEPGRRIQTYLFATGTLFTLPLACMGWTMPSARELLLLISIGILTWLNQVFIIKAFKKGPASIIAPFGYSSIVYAAFFNWLIFENPLQWTSLAGAVFIASGGLIIARFGSSQVITESSLS